MTDFESELVNKVLKELQDLNISMVTSLEQIRSEIKESKVNYENLLSSVNRNTEVEAVRLKEHGDALDRHAVEIAKLKEWRDHYEKQVTHRIAISHSIFTVVAVVIAFVLNKFF